MNVKFFDWEGRPAVTRDVSAWFIRVGGSAWESCDWAEVIDSGIRLKPEDFHQIYPGVGLPPQLATPPERPQAPRPNPIDGLVIPQPVVTSGAQKALGVAAGVALAGAAAMWAYALQVKNRQLEIDALEIRFRAERRLGELIAEQRKTVGLASRGEPYCSTGSKAALVEQRAPTLAEAGIDKKLSALAQRYASIPSANTEAMLTPRRERIESDNARVTVKQTSILVYI